jgi:hypothetical protein
VEALTTFRSALAGIRPRSVGGRRGDVDEGIKHGDEGEEIAYACALCEERFVGVGWATPRDGEEGASAGSAVLHHMVSAGGGGPCPSFFHPGCLMAWLRVCNAGASIVVPPPSLRQYSRRLYDEVASDWSSVALSARYRCPGCGSCCSLYSVDGASGEASPLLVWTRVVADLANKYRPSPHKLN